jgi:hypothetical protein
LVEHQSIVPWCKAERRRVSAGLTKLNKEDTKDVAALAAVEGPDALETLMTVLRHKLVRRGHLVARSAPKSPKGVTGVGGRAYTRSLLSST